MNDLLEPTQSGLALARHGILASVRFVRGVGRRGSPEWCEYLEGRFDVTERLRAAESEYLATGDAGMQFALAYNIRWARAVKLSLEAIVGESKARYARRKKKKRTLDN